jgi:hypothetical protein
LRTIAERSQHVETRASGGNDLNDVCSLGEFSRARSRPSCRFSNPPKVDPFLNLKTAKALGITVPLPLFGHADEIFE